MVKIREAGNKDIKEIHEILNKNPELRSGTQKETYNLDRPEVQELERHSVSQRLIRTLIKTGE